MRKLVFLLTGVLFPVVLSLNTSFAADLTILETLDYINQKLSKNLPAQVPLTKIDERAKSVEVSLNDHYELVVAHGYAERLYEKKKFLLCNSSKPEKPCEKRSRRTEAQVSIRDIYNKYSNLENPKLKNPHHADIKIGPGEQIIHINLFCQLKEDCVRIKEYQWGGGRMLTSPGTQKFLSISMGPNSRVAEQIQNALYHLLKTVDEETSQTDANDPF